MIPAAPNPESFVTAGLPDAPAGPGALRVTAPPSGQRHVVHHGSCDLMRFFLILCLKFYAKYAEEENCIQFNR